MTTKPNFTKELYFNIDNGNNYLIDEQSQIKCNIYGMPVTKFHLDESGFKRDSSCFLENKYKTYDKTFYRPLKKFFDGYFQFPTPMERMFYNRQFFKDNTKIKTNPEDNKKEYEFSNELTRLNNLVKGNYKNVPPVNQETPYQRSLPFLTHKVFKGEQNNLDKKIIIKKFLERIESNDKIRDKNKVQAIQENISLKDNIKKIKKDNKFTLFNQKIPEPSDKIKAKYKEIHEEIISNKKQKEIKKYVDKYRNKSEIRKTVNNETTKLLTHTFSDFFKQTKSNFSKIDFHSTLTSDFSTNDNSKLASLGGVVKGKSPPALNVGKSDSLKVVNETIKGKFF